MDIKDILDNALVQMKEKGADKGQIFITKSENKEFNLENGEFTLFRTVFNQDINVIVYKNQKKGSCFLNKLDEASVDYAIETAMTSLESSEVDEAYDIAPNQGEIKVSKGVWEADTDKLFDRTKEFVDDIKNNHPKIKIQQLIISHNRRHMVFGNTNGTFCDEYIGSYFVSIEIAGHEGDVTTSLLGCGVKLDNLELPFMKVGNIERTIKTAEEQLEMKAFADKFTGTMVLTPEALDTFVYYIGAIFAGNYTILNGSSIWLDKIGQKVADERITIKIDPDANGIVCGETLTYDGFKSEPYYLIKNGILESFMINQYTAKKTGKEMAKNGSFSAIIATGDKSIDEMICGIDKGILVGGFSGGEPAVNGDFSGVAKNSYIIENGKIAYPVSEAMINGNLSEMLFNLIDISKERLINGMDEIPYMAFGGITVSGK